MCSSGGHCLSTVTAGELHVIVRQAVNLPQPRFGSLARYIQLSLTPGPLTDDDKVATPVAAGASVVPCCLRAAAVPVPPKIWCSWCAVMPLPAVCVFVCRPRVNESAPVRASVCALREAAACASTRVSPPTRTLFQGAVCGYLCQPVGWLCISAFRRHVCAVCDLRVCTRAWWQLRVQERPIRRSFTVPRF